MNQPLFTDVSDFQAQSIAGGVTISVFASASGKRQYTIANTRVRPVGGGSLGYGYSLGVAVGSSSQTSAGADAEGDKSITKALTFDRIPFFSISWAAGVAADLPD